MKHLRPQATLVVIWLFACARGTTVTGQDTRLLPDEVLGSSPEVAVDAAVLLEQVGEGEVGGPSGDETSDGASDDGPHKDLAESLVPTDRGDVEVISVSDSGPCLKRGDCPVGSFCQEGLCVPWVCVPGSRVCEENILKVCSKDGDGFVEERDCDDGDPCTVGDRCENLQCVPGEPLDCQDSDPCTVDVCSPTEGCTHVLVDGLQCDDGDPCTVNDKCTDGKCVGVAKDCDDKNSCTDDWCESSRGCVHYPNQAICDDANACTVGDRCVEGVCEGLSICDDLDPCTLDLCKDGVCSHELIPNCGPCQTDAQCEDNNPCSLDFCVEGTCIHVLAPEPPCCDADTDCDDEIACTSDECIGPPFGVCRHRAVPSVECCAYEPFSAQFTGGGLNGLTCDPPTNGVGWQVVASSISTSAPWALYYGNPAAQNYDSGGVPNFGSATTPDILLPAGVAIWLEFSLWMDVEASEAVDVLTVEALAGGRTYLLWRKPAGLPMKTWTKITVNISALQGRVLRFRFTFDTKDALENFGQGIFMDDIRVTSTCKPFKCANDTDCESVGVVGSCVLNVCDFEEVLTAQYAFGQGELTTPYGVAAAPDRIFVSDKDAHRINVYSPDGVFLFAFGSKGSGEGQLQSPRGLAVGLGRVFVADTGNHRIAVFTEKGIFMFAFGKKGSSEGEFNEPKDIAVTPDGGVIYVADTSNHRIQAFDRDGLFLLAFGEYGKKPGQFRSPSCVLVSSDYRVLVCDTQNHRIQIFTWDGEFISSLQGAGELALDSPYGVALQQDGTVFVADTLHHRLVMFAPEGIPFGAFGGFGDALGQFRYPMGLSFDPAQRLYVADSSNRRIVVVWKSALP